MPVEDRTGLTEKKSIVFFTHAPKGTLGDPSATSKLITNIQARYEELIDITVVLLVQDEYQETVCGIFKSLDISILHMPSLNLHYEGYDTKGQEINLDKVLRHANGIIFFPTFHHFTVQDIRQIHQYNVPSFIVTEYDLHPSNRKVQLEKLGTMQTQFLQITSGIAADAQGIFCTEETDTSNNISALSQIHDSSDLAFRDLLLDGKASESYHENHHLFFGYFNKLNNEMGHHKTNPKLFIETCLSLMSESEKDIDFVLPLTLHNEHRDEDNHYKSIEELISYFHEHPEIIQNYRFEFWIKNSQGEMECLQIGGEGKNLIRFINGYPFTPNTMDKLMKASDEFVLITGDQSLSEAISNNKIFLYQPMWWKQELWNSLVHTTKELLGEESPLYQLFTMQNAETHTTTEDLIATLRLNKSELLQEIATFRQYILDNKNLYHNLPTQIIHYIQEPKAFLKSCIDNNQQIDIRQIRSLVKLYPEERDTIINYVIEQKKCLVNRHKLLQYLSDRRLTPSEHTFFQQYRKEAHKQTEELQAIDQSAQEIAHTTSQMIYYLAIYPPQTSSENAIYQQIYKSLVLNKYSPEKALELSEIERPIQSL